MRVDRPSGIYVYDLPDLSILFLVFVHLPALSLSLSSTIRTSSLDCTATVHSRSAGLSHRLYYSQHVGRFESESILSRISFFPSTNDLQRTVDQQLRSFFGSLPFFSPSSRVNQAFSPVAAGILTQWRDVYARNINYRAVNKISSSCFQSIIKAWHKTPELRYKLFTGE